LDCSVTGRFEEFEVAAPDIEKENAQIVEFLLVNDRRFEEVTEQRGERVPVVCGDTGIVKLY
jgi:hypothetical protein